MEAAGHRVCVRAPRPPVDGVGYDQVATERLDPESVDCEVLGERRSCVWVP
ncbi:hypothetical protein [Streptomyces sp. NPDC052012]|uniref:hypothetical protein n=1 Tax=Streptomyces sp. NPDC052012 TaxID=3155051 RepID=UPI00344CD0EC